MKKAKICLMALTLTFVIIGTASVFAAETPPAPQLDYPPDGAVVAIDTLTLKWDTIPHDLGYYWVSYAPIEDMDWWNPPTVPRIQGTECIVSMENLENMVYSGYSDTFYWRVQAELDVSYYFPESWSPHSDVWCFNVLKWPAAWIDINYWEGYTTDNTLEWIDNQTYSKMYSWESIDSGSWMEWTIPITVSPSAQLCWSDRNIDEQQKRVAFADFYRVQLDTSSSFSNPVDEATTEDVFYVTPELSPGVYYWRVRSERNDSLVTDWNYPRTFVIAEDAPETPEPEDPDEPEPKEPDEPESPKGIPGFSTLSIILGVILVVMFFRFGFWH